jgi:hypothetical protein
MALLAALWWEDAELASAPVWKTGENGFETRFPPQTFERSGLLLNFILARLVPIGAFARWANLWFAFGALTRHPFVLASVTTIPLLFECDQCHEPDNILDNNIL